MRKTYKYRLYPTRKQARLLEAQLEECQWVYNKTLWYRKTVYEEHKISLSGYDTNKLLPYFKKERPSLKSVHSQTLQDVQARLNKAYEAFFERVKRGEKPGYPRYKSKGRYDSLTFKQAGFKIDQEAGGLYLAKTGNVKIKLHRSLPVDAKIVAIRRTPTGKWYASFPVEVENIAAWEKTGKVIAGDLGLTAFLTFSDGSKIKNPRYYRKAEKRLKKAQSRRDRDKNNKGKKQAYALAAERVGNQRRDHACRLANELLRECDVICLEDLSIARMLAEDHKHKPKDEKGKYINQGLRKSIQDASWGMFVEKLVCKAEEAGKRVILIDPRNTTKTCNKCGSVKAKSLAERKHDCKECGYKSCRDLNAALNILAVGQYCLEKGIPTAGMTHLLKAHD